MSYVPTEEERRAFIDALEENCSQLMGLKKDELRTVFARLVDALSISPSTIIPELYQKLLATGLGQREVSIAFGILIGASIDPSVADKLFSTTGIEAVKAEATRYVGYHKR